MNNNRAGLLLLLCALSTTSIMPIKAQEKMSRTEINNGVVQAEVREAFDGYNAALDAGDPAALNAFFWNSPETVRFGPTENLFGYDEISSFRSTRWSAGPPRKLVRMVVTAFGNDVAVTSAVFERADTGALSRQTQTWSRFAEGWRIVAAHVSGISSR